MHSLQRKKNGTHFAGPFLKKLDFTVQKVQKNGPILQFFPELFQIGTHHIA